ncbi:MAG: hypothetical protein FJ294_05490 [Planctomycetes bacterium]|nr:hypothetical protein [Planctomycetota bacterium]
MLALVLIALGAWLQEGEDAPSVPRLGMPSGEIGGTTSVTGLAFDDRGGLWVCDPERGGMVLHAAGSTQMVEVRALARISDVAIRGESIFVSGSDAVVELSLSGVELRRIGAWGRAPGELREPGGIAVAGDLLYIADTGNDRVQRFSLADGAVRTCGERGRSEGQFLRPSDIAVDDVGCVYVSDSGNHRVVKLDRDLKFLKAWGDFGPHPGFFAEPDGLAWHAGELYVVDADNHRVQVFDAEGGRRHEWGLHALLPREGDGKLHYPRKIAVRAETTALSEPYEDRVQIFRRTEPGEEVPQPQRFERVVSAHFGGHVSVAGDLAALCEPTAPSFVLYDVNHALEPWEPVLVARSGSWGRRVGQMLAPSDIELDSQRRQLWLADADAGTLSLWSLDHDESKPLEFDFFKARMVRSLDFAVLHAQRLDGAREPIRPNALELGPDGSLLVLDTLARSLFVVAGDLSSVRLLCAELGPRPVDVAWSELHRRAWIVDAQACRVGSVALDEVQAHYEPRFGERGRGDGELLSPSGVAVVADGTLLVVDEALHRVSRFDPSGTWIGSFGSRGAGSHELHKPRGIDVDEQGRAWVVDWGNHRVQVVSLEGEFLASFGARAFVREALRSK